MRVRRYSLALYEEKRLVKGERVSLSQLADLCRCQKEVINALVRFGVIDPVQKTKGQFLFSESAIPRVKKALRLRNDLGINLNALGLVLDLLDRIQELEDELKGLK